jgi:hypothetical protein
MIQLMIAAACGWFLLVPPLVGTPRQLENEPYAPLIEWKQLSAHETVRECEVERKDLYERMSSIMAERIRDQGKRILTKDERSVNAGLIGQLQARCIPDVLLVPAKK